MRGDLAGPQMKQSGAASTRGGPVSVSTPSRAVQNELRMLTVEEFASAWLSDDRLCWGL
ncbi:hypothetical protein THAOC_28605, partial [Thalassiosira oceanica]